MQPMNPVRTPDNIENLSMVEAIAGLQTYSRLARISGF